MNVSRLLIRDCASRFADRSRSRCALLAFSTTNSASFACLLFVDGDFDQAIESERHAASRDWSQNPVLPPLPV